MSDNPPGLKLRLPEPETADTGGFGGLGDARKGKFLGLRLLQLIELINGPATIWLDGKWGSGKSVFLRQFRPLLEEKGYQVVHFDCFESEYINNAFVAMMSALVDELTEQGKPTPIEVMELSRRAKRIRPLLMRSIVFSGVSIASGGLVNEEVLKSVESSLFGNSYDELIEDGRKKRAEINEFKEQLTIAAQASVGRVGAQPKGHLIVFVDELDRCRPDYALEILECMKHFMSVPKILFVIGGCLNAASAMVETRYGSNISGKAYLKKFYDLRVDFDLDLPPNFGSRPIQRGREFEHYVARRLGGELGENWYGLNELAKHVAESAVAHELSIRDLNQVIITLILAINLFGLSYDGNDLVMISELLSAEAAGKPAIEFFRSTNPSFRSFLTLVGRDPVNNNSSLEYLNNVYFVSNAEEDDYKAKMMMDGAMKNRNRVLTLIDPLRAFSV